MLWLHITPLLSELTWNRTGEYHQTYFWVVVGGSAKSERISILFVKLSIVSK